MIVTGHHTCSSVGNLTKNDIKLPFLSEHIESEPSKHKFLGTGYYFWDNNIGMAHSHGQNNYKRKYHIFEAKINSFDKSFLDLAGNRIDMLFLENFIKICNVKNKETINWSLAQFIELLKTVNKFPYRAIRAIDTSFKPKKVIKFISSRDSYINLNPIFIVCLQDTKSDLIHSFKHIKTFN